MRYSCVLLLATTFFVQKSTGAAQLDPKPEDATLAVLHAFETHDIVMFGEIHGNKQEYNWLRSLISTPGFADRVDDIVMEFGNSLYQKSVDRYIAGGDVPIEQVQKAWRNMTGSVGPPSPMYAWLYEAVREMNMKRPGKHQMRILCGDPYIDWDKVKTPEDIHPYLSNRDEWYTQVVEDEVLAKHHRALLIMGWGHFLRGQAKFVSNAYIEPHLRQAGAKTYLIVFGTNAVGSYDDLDHRFDRWPAPVIVSLAGNWVGELPTIPVVTGGEDLRPHMINLRRDASGKFLPPAPPPPPPAPVKLKNAADALLYLGSRDTLTEVSVTKAELEGTPYGKEIQRRLLIEGLPSSFGEGADKAESPQFPRPEPDSDAGLPSSPAPAHPSMNMGPPPSSLLPPRPPSQ